MMHKWNKFEFIGVSWVKMEIFMDFVADVIQLKKISSNRKKGNLSIENVLV